MDQKINLEAIAAQRACKDCQKDPKSDILIMHYTITSTDQVMKIPFSSLD